MDSTETRQLRIAYADIINGYCLDYLDSVPVYIKHLSLKDQVLIDKTYLKEYQQALSAKIPTEKERLKLLKDTNQWTAKDESEIRDCESMLSGLQKTRATVMLKSDLKRIKEEILKEETNLSNKLTKKFLLLGTTAESFTTKKINDLFLTISFFKDPELTKPLFSSKEFDEDFDEVYISKLHDFYALNIERVGIKIIKKIALSPFFRDLLTFSNSAFDFFGKPVCQLTFFQSDLYAWGKYFIRLLEGQNPPEHVMDDPDKFIDWVTSSKAMRAEIERMANKGMDVSIVGASKEDYIDSGLSGHFVDLTMANEETLRKYT